jgi:hypothetical protein
VFASLRKSQRFLLARQLNGAGTDDVLAGPTPELLPLSFSSDGRWLAVLQPKGGNAETLLRNDRDRKLVHFPAEAYAADGAISPDGKRILYSSRNEVFQQPLPKEDGTAEGNEGKIQISKAGGAQPLWRPDGKELFYLAPDGTLMAVPVEAAPSGAFHPGTAKELFNTHVQNDRSGRRYEIDYDVTRGGQRFLINVPLTESQAPPITLIVNWPKLLERAP